MVEQAPSSGKTWVRFPRDTPNNCPLRVCGWQQSQSDSGLSRRPTSRQLSARSPQKGKPIMNSLRMQDKVTVVSALTEGTPRRSIERMTGKHRDTICRLLVSTGSACASLMDMNVRNSRTRELQIDEIWTYVGKKKRQRARQRFA
jgi:hypothetical protein